MSRWFRMYADVLDDPKVQRLPPDLFKAWVNLLCLASRNDGVLPSLEDVSFALRMSHDVTRDMIVTLSRHGLLDGDDELSPHNWAERQFKSDSAEDAKIRKRRQREREKTANVTENVTTCHSDSHNEVTPPEQNRTDQNISYHSVDDDEPKHREEVQGFLDNHADDLNAWDTEFLISIKWVERLTKAQTDKLNMIREKVNPPAQRVYPSVKRGTPAYDAWIAYYRRTGRPTAFYEKQDAITVTSEYPPQEQAA